MPAVEGARMVRFFCGAWLTVTLIDPVVAFAGDDASVALMANEVVPALVGVPIRLQPFICRPAGRFPPAMAQV